MAPDLPAQFHWPYLHSTRQMVYLDGGRQILTIPKSDSETALVWDRRDLRRPKAELAQFPPATNAVEVDTAGRRLLLSVGPSVDQNTIISLQFDQLDKPVIYRAEGQKSGTTLSPDGSVAATCRNQTVHLWDPTSGDELRVLKAQFNFPEMQFSPSGKRLLIKEAGKTHLFEVANGQLLQTYQRPMPSEKQVTLSIAQHFLDDETVFGYGTIWPGAIPAIVKWTPDTKRVTEYMRLPPRITWVVVAVGKKYAIFLEPRGDDFRRLHVLDIAKNHLIRSLDGHHGQLIQAVISPDETEVATLDSNGPLRFWHLNEK